MPECRYCDRRFDDEDDYERHLRNAHAEELGPIDRRRVGLAATADGDGLSAWVAPLAIGGVLVLAGIVVAYVVFLSGSGAGDAEDGPSDVGAVHYHGTIDVRIGGERIDFGRQEYQLRDEAFHFEGDESERWHAHAREVTLEYAMATVGIELTDSTVTFEGRTYDGADPGTTVAIEVDGEPVEPGEYVLEEGDHVRIVAHDGGEGGDGDGGDGGTTTPAGGEDAGATDAGNASVWRAG